MDFAYVKTAYGGSNQTICACRKCCVELRFVGWQLVDRLNFIEVEWKFAWYATIQSSLQIRRPILAQNSLSTDILFADASNTRIHRFTAIDVFDSRFPEEKVHIFADVEGAHKIWFWKFKWQILLFTRFSNRELLNQYALSNHLESYFNVRLKLYSLRPFVKLYRSVRKITVSALVNSAFVPEYCKRE